MTHEVKTLWKGGMAFEADVNGYRILMDTDEAGGGTGAGPRPKPLLLAAIAGCSGMDIVSILKKMREPCTWFETVVEADTADEHPKRYVDYRIVYRFKTADGLNPENVKKAVSLSQDKYCGVSATLKACAPVAWRIEYI